MNINNLNQICLNCFKQISENVKFCPFCGYTRAAEGDSIYQLPPRTILSGKYLICRVLGEGGFGITYLGYDLNLDIKVAIKEFYPSGLVMRATTMSMTVQPMGGEQGEYFVKGRERFVDEAKRLARFRTLPGIVMVNDFFVENGTAYIVMEYVEGTTLKNCLAHVGGKFPADQIFEMLLPVFRSLAQVHESGIIHRDISPDNIMISLDGSVKLLDFGAAREFTDADNKSLSVMLKHGYAPAEQYSSKGVQGPYTDVYALCATIYKAITGMTPDDSMDRVLDDRLAPPSYLGVAIPAHQEAALMRGLAVRVENRYRTVGELFADLRLEGETRQTYAPSVAAPYVPPAPQPAPPAALPYAPGPVTPAPHTAFPYTASPAPSPMHPAAVPYAPPVQPTPPPVQPAVPYTPTPPVQPAPEPVSVSYAPADAPLSTPAIADAEPLAPQEAAPLSPADKKKRVITIAAVSCVAVALIFMIVYLTGDRGANDSGSGVWDPRNPISERSDTHEPVVINLSEIPDLTALSYAEAGEILGRLDIPFVTDAEYDSNVEPGTVISYSYDEDEERIWLIISAGQIPSELRDPEPPLILGYTTYYGNAPEGKSGSFAIMTDGDSRVTGLRVRSENPNDGDFRELVTWGGLEPRIPVVRTWTVSNLVHSEFINSARAGRLSYSNSYIIPAIQSLNNNWQEVGSVNISPITLNVSFSENVAPQINAVRYVSGPELENDDNNYGSIKYLLSGDFWEGERYYVSSSSQGLNIGGEFTCEINGELEVYGWGELNPRNEQAGYIPRRIEIMECIRFIIDETAGVGYAEFSRLSAWAANPFNEYRIPDLVGWTYSDALAALREAGDMEYGFAATHSNAQPEGLIINYGYDTNLQMVNLLFSAGPEPSPGVEPKPIMLGTAIERERWSGAEQVVIRWITPRVSGTYYSDLWYRASAGQRAGSWSSFGGGMSSELEPRIHQNNLDWVGTTLFREQGYDEYGMPIGLPSYEGEAALRIGASMYSQDSEWLSFDEMPDSRKATTEAWARVTVWRQPFLYSAQFMSSEIRYPDWSPDYSYNAVKYFITGDFDSSLIRQIRALDADGNEIGWEDNRHFRDGGIEVDLMVDEYYINEGRQPEYIVIYLRTEPTFVPDGMIASNAYYDIIEVNNAGYYLAQSAEGDAAPAEWEDWNEYDLDAMEFHTGNATHLRGEDYQVFTFDIVGSDSGSVWGSYIYTDDSNIATAAVHAGLVSVGEAATVRIMILPGEDSYESTTSNGITSSSYGRWSGSYVFE